MRGSGTVRIMLEMTRDEMNALYDGLGQFTGNSLATCVLDKMQENGDDIPANFREALIDTVSALFDGMNDTPEPN